MKRSLAAAAGGFVLGYAYAFVSWLIGSKNLGRYRKKQPPHPPGTCAEDCPWDSGHLRSVLNGDDMHDVLPTDDDFEQALQYTEQQMLRALEVWPYRPKLGPPSS